MNFRIDDVLGDIREDIKDIRKFIDLQKYHQFQQTERIQQHSKNRSQKVNVIPRSQLHYDEGNGVVGRGGFGTVVKGKYAGGPVAIKILSRARATGREVERELLKEAQVMQRISHPLVVRLYGVVNERTEKCLVIELALGSLHDLLYSDRRVLQDRLMDPPDSFRQPSSDRGSKYLLGFDLALLVSAVRRVPQHSIFAFSPSRSSAFSDSFFFGGIDSSPVMLIQQDYESQVPSPREGYIQEDDTKLWM